MNIVKSAYAAFRMLPILGDTFEIGFESHKEALKEWVPTILFTLTPILAGVFFGLASVDNKLSLYLLFQQEVSDGELFIYSATLLAPLHYFVLKIEKFPSEQAFILTIMSIIAISAFAFGLIRGDKYFEESFLDYDFLFSISVVLFFFSLIIVYYAFAYRNGSVPSASDIRDIRQSEEQEILDGLAALDDTHS